MQNEVFESFLSPYIQSLIEFKSEQGRNIDRYVSPLRLFDRYCISQGIISMSMLTKEVILQWREEMCDNNEKTVYVKFNMVNQLLTHMRDLGIEAPNVRLPKNGNDRYIPYIFSKDEICALFDAADNLRLAHNNLKGYIFCIPALLRLLYATGMRCGEAQNIQNMDYDNANATIVLRHTKNGCDRLVPLTESANRILLHYISKRQRLGYSCTEHPESPLFVSGIGKGINKKLMYSWFRLILGKAGIPHRGRKFGPRLHDLRHTFAVHTLQNRVEAGEDIYVTLPWLSAYLGHKGIYATEQYVRLAKDAMAYTHGIQETIAQEIYPSIEHETETTDW